MRGRLPQVVALAIGWLAVCPSAPSQPFAAIPAPSSPRICSSSSQIEAKTPAQPEVTIAELKFEGNILLPIEDQEQIAAEIKRESSGVGADGLIDGILERARLGWQDHGYFNVEVSKSSTKVLTSNPVSQRIAVVLHVEEGRQYRLKKITFRNHRIMKDVRVLRSLFPIADGELFSRDKISRGLESLRKAYGELGFVNFTSYPDTEVDEANSAISLQIDLDEGKLFYVGRLEILGLDQHDLRQALNDLALKPGDVYKWNLIEGFLLKYRLPGDEKLDSRFESHMDEESSTISLSFDFRPVSQD
jgi:outer membrane protein assembly factor BamA